MPSISACLSWLSCLVMHNGFTRQSGVAEQSCALRRRRRNCTNDPVDQYNHRFLNQLVEFLCISYALSQVSEQRTDLTISARCIAWRQTGECRPDGPREEAHDLPCHAVVPPTSSGYCLCEIITVTQWLQRDGTASRQEETSAELRVCSIGFFAPRVGLFYGFVPPPPIGMSLALADLTLGLLPRSLCL